MRGSPRDPRNYELMTVFTPDVPEDEIQATIDGVVGYITTASGEMIDVSRDSPWGRRRLAYPIRHASRDVRDGFYTLYHFQVAPHRVDDIERELKLNDRVMRYLLTQYTPKPVDEAAPATEEGAATATTAPVGDVVEPAAASAEGEAAAGDTAAPVEDVEIMATTEPVQETETAAEPEAAPATEAVEDVAGPVDAVADEVRTTDSTDDEADTEEATPPEEA